MAFPKNNQNNQWYNIAFSPNASHKSYKGINTTYLSEKPKYAPELKLSNFFNI